MIEELVQIIQRSWAPNASPAELALDVDRLEVAAINVLFEIENARRRLSLATDAEGDRAALLSTAYAATERARQVLKQARSLPTEPQLAEARAWLVQARDLLEQVPGLRAPCA